MLNFLLKKDVKEEAYILHIELNSGLNPKKLNNGHELLKWLYIDYLAAR